MKQGETGITASFFMCARGYRNHSQSIVQNLSGLLVARFDRFRVYSSTPDAVDIICPDTQYIL